MNKVHYQKILLLILVFGLSILLYYWFYNSIYYEEFFAWSKTNIVLFVVVLFLIKVAALLYPPLSGGILTLASIPFLGWQLAYATDFVGSMAGGIIMYFLGQKYGYRLLGKLFDKKVVERIRKIKIKKDKEFEAVLVYRLLLGGTIIELIYYGAGVLNVGFANFLAGSAVSHILVGIPSFYLTNNVLTGKNAVSILISAVLLIILFSKLKNRYFE